MIMMIVDCEWYTKHFGGSPANIAMNVKRLGGNSVIAPQLEKMALGII